MVPKMKEIQKVVQSYRVDKKLRPAATAQAAAAAAAYEPVQKNIKSPPVSQQTCSEEMLVSVMVGLFSTFVSAMFYTTKDISDLSQLWNGLI